MELPADQTAAGQPVLDWDMLHHELENVIWQGGEARHGEGLLVATSTLSCVMWPDLHKQGCEGLLVDPNA